MPETNKPAPKEAETFKAPETTRRNDTVTEAATRIPALRSSEHGVGAMGTLREKFKVPEQGAVEKEVRRASDAVAEAANGGGEAVHIIGLEDYTKYGGEESKFGDDQPSREEVVGVLKAMGYEAFRQGMMRGGESVSEEDMAKARARSGSETTYDDVGLPTRTVYNTELPNGGRIVEINEFRPEDQQGGDVPRVHDFELHYLPPGSPEDTHLDQMMVTAGQ